MQRRKTPCWPPSAPIAAGCIAVRCSRRMLWPKMSCSRPSAPLLQRSGTYTLEADVIVVTGAAGFIGSNLVMALNARGERNILAVDDLSDGTKFRNLAEATIADYMDKDEFLARIENGELPQIRAMFHQGACSTTTEWNGKFMMDVNYRYSKVLLHFCDDHGIPFIYASSASVYGMGRHGFREDAACERPLNMY